MNRSKEIVRKSESILAYITEQTRLTDSASPKDILPVIYGLQAIFPQWVSMICPVHHPEWFYVSENCEQLFGYSSSYFEKFLPPTKFFDLVEESDLDDLCECMSWVDQFLKEEASSDFHRFRMVFQYRFRHKNGQSILLHDEKAVHQAKDKLCLYYSLYRNISSELPFTGVSVEIYQSADRLVKVAEFKPSSKKKLSPRESQLIALIRKGFTTKEIAEQLSLSHNTVRNIRSRMLEKFSVSNAIELLNMAG